MQDTNICAGTCLLGIYPGSTTFAEAVSILQNHDWVQEVDIFAPGTGYGQIEWQWSGQQPDVVNDNHPGHITFYWDTDDIIRPELDDAIIQTISIYSTLRIALLQSWFDLPDSGTVNHTAGDTLGYSTAYNIQGGIIRLATDMPCPVDWMTYWNARTRFTLSIGRGSSLYTAPFEMVKLC